jgi:hypothetical protein
VLSNMATRVTQAGDDPYRDIPGYTQLDGQYKGLTARDYASLPVSYLENVADVAGAFPALITAAPAGLVGGLFGGKKGAKTGWELGGGKDLETVYQDYIRPIDWNTQEGFTYGAPDSAEAAASKAGYLETLLGGTPTFNREQYLSEQDPRLMGQLAAYDRMMAALRPEVEQAKSAVSGAYGAAAGAGRTAAGNIGTRGERTAATFEDLYGRAATEAGDMAQAGGTMVSGLTGPGQAFQDIYGGAYGLGGTEAYGTRGEAGLAAEGMRAQAQQAAGAGSRASSNIQNYWDRMTARERFAFDSALSDAQFQRGETLKLKEDQLSLSTGSLVGMYRDNKDMRDGLKKQFGSVTDQNYNTEIPRLLNQLSATYGPEAVLRTLQQSGLAFGATGG